MLFPSVPMTTRSQVTWVKDGFNWFLRFGSNCDGQDVSANRVTVSHPLADTWTIEGSQAILCRMPVKGRPTTELVGPFTMPMFMTLVQQN